MRKALRVSVLTLTLACSVYAGEIPNGVTNPPPPPPQTVSSMEQTSLEETGGEIPNGQSEAVTKAALSLLLSVLSLF